MAGISCTVPQGILVTGKSYQWQLDVQDSPSPYIPNNISRTNKLPLVVDNTRPNLLSAVALIRNEPDGIFTVVDSSVNDPGPNGAGLSSAMSLVATAPDGSSYTFLPADLIQNLIPVPAGLPKSYEYQHGIPGVLPDGTYIFTLNYSGGQSLVTNVSMHDGGRIPIADETTFQVTGRDPLTPTVSWSAIEGYPGHLYYRTNIVDSNNTTVYDSSRTPYTAQTVPAETLKPGQSYQFRVEAFGDPGWPFYNNRSNSHLLPLQFTALPGAPTSVLATAGNASASVSFTPPARDGESPIIRYTVTSIPDGKTGTGKNSPIIVKGLKNGTPCTFEVTATNKAGTGPASAPSSPAVIPDTVPGAPTTVKAVPAKSQATVTFKAPASDGGNAITGYTVTSHPDNLSANGASSPITMPGLTNGKHYSFTVTATNGVGSSHPSASSTSVTIGAVPDAPTAVTATSGNRQATVSFTAPLDDGGCPITSYTVKSNPPGGTGSGKAGPIKVTGLKNGGPYTFTVKAKNRIGIGPASALSAPVTPN